MASLLDNPYKALRVSYATVCDYYYKCVMGLYTCPRSYDYLLSVKLFPKVSYIRSGVDVRFDYVWGKLILLI